LLAYSEAGFPQTMRQSVFIYFFQVPMTQVNMQVIGDLTDAIAEREQFFLISGVHFSPKVHLRISFVTSVFFVVILFLAGMGNI
jgi:hypothetical protein